jgi:ABC-2 type transport system ATP-binding protein
MNVHTMAAAADANHLVVASAPAVRIRRLVVERGTRRTLDGISCTIPRGTVAGLLGPSGSGKTTLLRTVVGVQTIRSGSVTVLGRPAGDPALRHSVGYVTQAPSVYGDLTVRQNARYFASIHGVPVADADSAVTDVGLSAAAGQLVATLSGGQRSRVSIACALLARPRLLVLDEPTVGQDPALRRDLWDRFKALAAGGTTLLVSSHVMDEAARCDLLLLIRGGRLLAADTPEAIRSAAGTDDLEDAFLHLIGDDQVDAA